MKKIYIGSDHAGFELKEKLKPFVTSLGYEVVDLGADTYDSQDDYPDMCKPVAVAVANEALSLGIVLGGSGQGEAIVANRIKGIRACVYYGGPLDIIALSREHNDSNILSIGARMILESEAMEAVKLWLDRPFSGDERHVRRIKKIDQE